MFSIFNLLGFPEPVYEEENLLDIPFPFLPVTPGKGAVDTVLQVVTKEVVTHLAEGVDGRFELEEDVHTVPVLFYHTFDAPHLPLDPAQAERQLPTWRSFSLYTHVFSL